jgi:LmbE family N-acetylglucosaminyl deacetylase
MEMPYFSGRTLVICPHFDDACYSIGGLLLKKTAKEVTILTVFSKSENAPNLKRVQPFLRVNKVLDTNIFKKLVVEVVSKERQKEDQKFCNSLGAVQNILPFSDSLLRGYLNPCLTNAENINEEPIYKDVLRAIEKYISSGLYNYVLCPLAVGNHVDHLIVLKAFLQILKRNRDTPEAFFYEDLPYASAYGLDFIDSLARVRTSSNIPLFADITIEMPLKQNLIDLYRSQPRSEAKLSVLYHARRLFMSRDMRVDAAGYCERFWRLDTYRKYKIAKKVT